MGANADGVIARVSTLSFGGGELGRGLGRLGRTAVRSPLPVVALAAVLLAGFGQKLWSDHLESQEAAFALSLARLDMAASLGAHEARLIIGSEQPDPRHLDSLARSIPPLVLSAGRTIYLSFEDGPIVGSLPPVARRPRTLTDLLGDEAADAAPNRDSAARVGRLRDGTPVIVAQRGLDGAQLTVVQPIAALPAGAGWTVYGHPALALALLGGLAVAGGGCARYRARARAARRQCRLLAKRVDASLAKSRCGLFDWDVAAGRMQWSASMFEMLGYEARQEALGADEVAAMLHSERGSFRALLAEIASDPGQERDIRVRTAGGSWLWLRVKAERAAGVEGCPHIVGLALDVTEEYRETQSREAADGRLRDAVEAISEAFVLWDSEGRLVLCNSKFLKQHELAPELALPGTPHAQLMSAGRPPVLETPLTGSGLDPRVRTVEAQLFDGRWVQVNERRTKDGGVVAVATDVSLLKRKEARLRERERRLQGSVREAETEKQRLADLAERSIEANQAKTEFLARMSHELRTPLNAIIGFADMMSREMLGPLGCGRYSEYSRDIHASGLKLLSVIDGILHMARIEKGQVRVRPELLAIEGPLSAALGLVQAEMAAKELVLETDIVGPGLLHADPAALQDVLSHLLRNAVRFSQAQGVVRVRVRPACSRLNIFVEDDGIGISREVLPRLGRPFEQVEAEYRRSGGGTGLGLAIARALVELHGGRLRIRSEIGLGTVALVSLPVVQPPANDSEVGEAEMTCPRLTAAE